MLLLTPTNAVSSEQARKWDEEIYKSGESSYKMTVSEPRQVVGPDADLPEGVDILHSNNCLSIATYQDSLYIAWRSAPMHFASSKTKIFIMSS